MLTLSSKADAKDLLAGCTADREFTALRSYSVTLPRRLLFS